MLIEHYLDQKSLSYDQVEQLGLLPFSLLPLLEEKVLSDFAEKQALNPNALRFVAEARPEVGNNDQTALGLAILGLSYQQLGSSGIFEGKTLTRQAVGYRIMRSLRELYRNAPEKIRSKYDEQEITELFSFRSSKDKQAHIIDDLQHKYGSEIPIDQIATELEDASPSVRARVKRAIQYGFKVEVPRKSKGARIIRELATVSPQVKNEEEVRKSLDKVTLNIFWRYRNFFATPREIINLLEVPKGYKRSFMAEMVRKFPFGKITRQLEEGEHTYYFIPKQFEPNILEWAQQQGNNNTMEMDGM